MNVSFTFNKHSEAEVLGYCTVVINGPITASYLVQIINQDITTLRAIKNNLDNLDIKVGNRDDLFYYHDGLLDIGGDLNEHNITRVKGICWYMFSLNTRQLIETFINEILTKI